MRIISVFFIHALNVISLNELFPNAIEMLSPKMKLAKIILKISRWNTAKPGVDDLISEFLISSLLCLLCIYLICIIVANKKKKYTMPVETTS